MDGPEEPFLIVFRFTDSWALLESVVASTFVVWAGLVSGLLTQESRDSGMSFEGFRNGSGFAFVIGWDFFFVFAGMALGFLNEISSLCLPQSMVPLSSSIAKLAESLVLNVTNPCLPLSLLQAECPANQNPGNAI
jgi:hypothetical protein